MQWLRPSVHPYLPFLPLSPPQAARPKIQAKNPGSAGAARSARSVGTGVVGLAAAAAAAGTGVVGVAKTRSECSLSARFKRSLSKKRG